MSLQGYHPVTCSLRPSHIHSHECLPRQFFGLDEADVPAVRIINMAEEMAKYKPEADEINADTLTAFAQGCVACCSLGCSLFFWFI